MDTKIEETKANQCDIANAWATAIKAATAAKMKISLASKSSSGAMENFVKHEDQWMQIPFLTVCQMTGLQSKSGQLLNQKMCIVIGLANKQGTRGKVQCLNGTMKNIQWKNLQPTVNFETFIPHESTDSNCKATVNRDSVITFFNSIRFELKNNKTGRNLLHYACEHHRIDAVQWLTTLSVREGIVDGDFDMLWTADKVGATPLLLTTLHSQRPPRPPPSVGSMPGAKQVVWPETNSGTDIVSYLLNTGGPRVLEALNAPVNQGLADLSFEKNENDFITPMSKACYNNNLSMVKVLHQAGANCYSCCPHKTNNETEQPLFNAVKYASSLKIVQYLVQNGCNTKDVRYRDGLGGTPVLFATRWNNMELLKYLTIGKECRRFNAMADTNNRTSTSRTCIGIAFTNQLMEVAQFLILMCGCLPSQDYLRCFVGTSFLLQPRINFKQNLLDWSFNMCMDLVGNHDEEEKNSMLNYICEMYSQSQHFQVDSSLEYVFLDHKKWAVRKLIQFSNELEEGFDKRLLQSLKHTRSMFVKK